ncbi:cell division protein FtsQ/DivIB [Caulobacter sp. KR2-114]|uniref:cell division protein FtsQ/DivIB n=1 Tax=Caulobacter sp. KR2-114 TaxID=3400912 RepID=UPI003C05CCB8
MPAAVRGAERQAVKPRAKRPPSPSKSAKGAAAVAPSKLHAAQGVGLSPVVALAGTAAIVVLGVTIALATGNRGANLASSMNAGFDNRLAQAGFRVNAVHLQGASKAAEADILAATGLRQGQPIFGLDLAAVRASVEHVGWVKSAKVVRLLPDTLVVAVEERRMLAVWQHAGHSQVVDAEGNVVPEADPGRFAGLPLVVGEGADKAAGEILPAIASRPRLAQRVEAAVRVDDRRWDLRLKDGGLIQLPAAGEEAALIRLDQLDDKSRILELGFARIDLRDPEMVAVRPRASTGAPALVADGV